MRVLIVGICVAALGLLLVQLWRPQIEIGQAYRASASPTGQHSEPAPALERANIQPSTAAPRARTSAIFRGPTLLARLSPQPTFFHGDSVGTTHATTGAAGQVLEWQATLPFGRPLREASTPAYFGGKRAEEPVIDFGARRYHARLGRFAEADPQIAPDTSPYAYASNAPLTRIDPDGREDIRTPGPVGLLYFPTSTHPPGLHVVRRFGGIALQAKPIPDFIRQWTVRDFLDERINVMLVTGHHIPFRRGGWNPFTQFDPESHLYGDGFPASSSLRNLPPSRAHTVIFSACELGCVPADDLLPQVREAYSEATVFVFYAGSAAPQDPQTLRALTKAALEFEGTPRERALAMLRAAEPARRKETPSWSLVAYAANLDDEGNIAGFERVTLPKPQIGRLTPTHTAIWHGVQRLLGLRD